MVLWLGHRDQHGPRSGTAVFRPGFGEEGAGGGERDRRRDDAERELQPGRGGRRGAGRGWGGDGVVDRHGSVLAAVGEGSAWGSGGTGVHHINQEGAGTINFPLLFFEPQPTFYFS